MGSPMGIYYCEGGSELGPRHKGLQRESMMPGLQARRSSEQDHSPPSVTSFKRAETTT